jgi:hypothetical protein
MYEDIYRWDLSPIQLRECFFMRGVEMAGEDSDGKEIGVRRSGPLSLSP